MPQNATYKSPEIQNELIDIIAYELRSSIVTEMNNSTYLTLMADGATDRNGNEIFSISYRYIKNGDPIESLLCFEKAEDRSASGLFQIIIDRMAELGLNIEEKLLSQCYDGAAVNSGRLNGLQALIQKHFNRTIPYVHCISHRLHLVVVEIVKNNHECRLFFDQLKLFHAFFRRYKVFVICFTLNIDCYIFISYDYSNSTGKKILRRSKHSTSH